MLSGYVISSVLTHTDVDFRVIYVVRGFLLSKFGGCQITYVYVTYRRVPISSVCYYSGEGTLTLGWVDGFMFPWFSDMGVGG